MKILFNARLTKRLLNFPNGASPLFPLSPSIFEIIGGKKNQDNSGIIG